MHTCSKCGSTNTINNGYNKSGTPQYRCKDCGTCRVTDRKSKVGKIDIKELVKAYKSSGSLRGTAKMFGISHPTVIALLKKKRS